MEVSEALEREVIVERARALQRWLDGLELSRRARGALERELAGIINNDPGGYLDGQRPLAGLTSADFINELHSPGAGAVGRVQRVGQGVISELRAAMPANITEPAKPRQRQRRVPVPAATVDVDLPLTEAPAEALAAEPAPAAPRRRGRPKGSLNKPRVLVNHELEQLTVAATPPTDERPLTPGADAPANPPDPVIAQLLQIWPELHPHARRAIMLYASMLLAEG